MNSLFQNLWFVAINTHHMSSGQWNVLPESLGKEPSSEVRNSVVVQHWKQAATQADVPQNLQEKSKFPSPCVFPLIKELCKSFAQTVMDVSLHIYSLLMGTVLLARQITLLHCLCIKGSNGLLWYSTTTPKSMRKKTLSDDLMGRAKEMIKTALLYKVPCHQSGKGDSDSVMIACESCGGTSPELATACKFYILRNWTVLKNVFFLNLNECLMKG